MTKKILYSLIILVLGFSVGYHYRAPIAEAYAAYTTYMRSASATTTPTYLVWGSATSTRVVPTNNVGNLEVSILATASSSNPTNFDLTFLTSEDNIDYYPMLMPIANVTASTSVSINTSGTVYSFNLATAATTSLPVISITPTGAFTKVQVTVGTTTNATSKGAVHVKIGQR